MITDEQVMKALDAYYGIEHVGGARESLIEKMRKALEAYEQSKPKPEPVAYRWWNQGCNCDECDQYFYSEDPDFISKNREPLYTTPPTREPLSAYMIIDFLRKNESFDELFDDGTAVKFARAIEQAHGIGTP